MKLVLNVSVNILFKNIKGLRDLSSVVNVDIEKKLDDLSSAKSSLIIVTILWSRGLCV